MKKTTTSINLEDQPLESLLLQFKEEKYKVSYAAIRWAREIKKKESLNDPVPTLVARALREILSGKISIKEIENLPMISRASAPVVAAQPVAAPHPTITLNVTPEKETESSDDEDEDVEESSASKE